MSLTPSNMVALGSIATDFELQDTVTGTLASLDDLKSDDATLIMFLCNHCPYVKHVREELVRLANEYIQKNVSFIAISSNDVESYPEDSPELMKTEALTWNYPFPYLYDETQKVARDYKAACTPDFFLYGKNMELVYRGQLDGSRPGNEIPLTGKDLRGAINNLLHNIPVTEMQMPSVGCNIKWKEFER
jgi:thiol-disulfide isomerase/thioredoxin